MKIAIDVGHARNTGARGNGHEEHDLASNIAEHICNELNEQGFEADYIDFPELSNKADLNRTIQQANSGGYDIGISIHCDSASYTVERKGPDGPEKEEIPNPLPHGAHVCYYPSSTKGKHLAASIASQLCEVLPGRSEKIKSRSDLAVLKRTKPVWVLCECGFITNVNDVDIMKHHPESIANAIVAGIESYIYGG